MDLNFRPSILNFEKASPKVILVIRVVLSLDKRFHKEEAHSNLKLKNQNKLLHQKLLTSGLKRASKPLPEPSRETPKENSIIKMIYGIVAVMYTTWKEIWERNWSSKVKNETKLTLRACITFVLFQAYRWIHTTLSPDIWSLKWSWNLPHMKSLWTDGEWRHRLEHVTERFKSSYLCMQRSPGRETFWLQNIWKKVPFRKF